MYLRWDVAQICAARGGHAELVAEGAQQTLLAQRIDLEQAGSQTTADRSLDLERLVEMLGRDPTEIREESSQYLHVRHATAAALVAKCPKEKGLHENGGL